MRIRATNGYLVNLMDTKGDRLMSDTDVQTVIDDRLGAILDTMPTCGVLGIQGKMQLHAELLARLPDLVKVHEMVQAFEEAKADR